MKFITEVIMGFFYGIVFCSVTFGIVGFLVNLVDKKKHTHLEYKPVYLSSKKKKHL